jgi:hypothetical protein
MEEQIDRVEELLKDLEYEIKLLKGKIFLLKNGLNYYATEKNWLNEIDGREHGKFARAVQAEVESLTRIGLRTNIPT